MAQAWQEQNKNPKLVTLCFDERFAMLVDAEHMARENRRIGRLLKDAQLRIDNACVEDIDTSAERGLDKAVVRQFASCTWIHDHLNIALTGKTGVGKSYVASALGQNACRKGYRVQTLSCAAAARRARPGSVGRVVCRVPRSPREGGCPDPG